MKYSNTVEYNISTKLDSSGLTKLQSQIKQLENSMQQMANRELLNSDKVQAAKTQLEGLNTALTNSFNSSLGILDLSKFRAELDAGGVSAKGLQSAFNMMGAEGQAALNGLTTQIANFNGGMERTSSAVDKIFTTFSNTFRWGMVSSFFSQFMNAIHSSIDYVKELDDSLTQIMLVTDYNKDSMNEFARSANEAAKAVSMTTTGMTNASLIFAQQGYDLNQSQQLATLSAKVANASQQDTATTSDQITAYMNAYGLENSIGELTQAMDNWALIANISAADVGELAKASQRAASMANAVGVSGEALAAQIATIESVTREAPEQIGNGLKTLYARFSDISLGGEDEDGVGLGKVTSILEGIGVKVLDEFGNIRTMDAIMEDLMVIWDDLDTTTKTAAAQALAGKYQVNRFEALMENSDMYRQYKDATGENAVGTLDTMNEEYANSIAGRSAKMQASLEGLFSTIFNTDDIYPWMDAAQGAIDLLQQFFDALGGGKIVLLGITSLLGQAFSQNMARSINDMIANRNLGKIREQNIATVGDTLDRAGIDRSQGIGKYIDDTADQAKLGALSDAQYDTYMNNVQQWSDASIALSNSERELTKNIDSYNLVMLKKGMPDAAVTEDDGNINLSNGLERKKEALINKENLSDNLDFSEDIEETQELLIKLQEVQKTLDELRKAKKIGLEADQIDPYVKNVEKKVSDAQKQLEVLRRSRGEDDDLVSKHIGTINNQAYEELNNQLQTIADTANEVDEEFSQAERTLGKVRERVSDINQEATELSQNSKKIQDTVIKGDKNIQSLKATRDFNQTQENRAGENALDSQKNVDDQQDIKGILDTLNAVQQLTFAWQAFQNLGSLWTNEDLSTGEKVLQTIMNLTMAMPQLITAMDTLKNSGGVFEALNQGIKDFSIEGDFFASLKEKAALDERSIAAEEKVKSLMERREQISKLLNTSKQEEFNLQKHLGELETSTGKNARERHLIALDISRTKERINEQETTTNMLQDAQKANAIAINGAVVAEEGVRKIVTAELIKQVALQAALTFGIPLLLAGLATAVGYYQQQREEEEKLRQEQLQASNEKTAQTKEQMDSIQNLYTKYKETGEGADELRQALEEQAEALGIVVTAADDYDTLKQKIDEATVAQLAYNAALREEEKPETPKLSNILSNDTAEALGLDTSTTVINNPNNYTSSYVRNMDKEDPVKLIPQAEKLVEIEQEKIAARERSIALLDDEVARGAKTREQANAELNDLKEKNKISQNRVQESQNLINSTKEAYDNENELAENRVMAQALMPNSIFSSTVNDKGQNIGTSYEQALHYVQSLTEGLSITEQKQAELAAKALEYAGNLEGAAEAQLTIAQNQIEQNPYVYSGIRAGESGMNKINELGEKFDLSDQDKAKVSELIDWSDTNELDARVADLAEEIEEGLSQGMSLDDILSKMKEDQEIELTDDEILKQERDDKGYVGEDWDRDVEGVKEYADSLQDLAEVSDDIADSLKNNRKEALKIADANARLNKGVKSLADSWDDWNKIISDTSEGIEATEDYSDAIHGVEDALTNIFDFDISSGLADSTQFIKEHMDDIAAAAEGDMDAIERLRVAAAQQILIDADFDWNKINISQEELFGLISELDNEEVEVGATLDTTTFGEALAIALQAVGATTEEMQKVFNSLGWEPDVTYEDYKVTDNSKQTTDGTIEIADPKAEGGRRTVKVTDEVVFNGDNTVTIPKINAKGTTYQGSAPKIASPSSRGSSGGGGGSCFVAGTLVTTLTGFSPIEQIKQGDIVLSYNESSHQLEYSTVVQTMIHDIVEPIYTLHVKNEQLRVTGIHRFLVSHDIFHLTPQWVPATDLQIGDWMFLADGTWHLIHNIEVNIEHQIVYNFEVAGNHNYYVGRNQILAHNKGGKSCFVAGTAISTSLGFKPIEIIKADDIVLSYNELLHQNEYSKVVQTMIHDTVEPIYTLYIKNEQLRVTGIHRFLISKNINFKPQWVAAQDLQIGNWVLLADGTWHLIWKIEINLEHQIVYNFEVSNNHNYYVGRNQILAHNKGGGGKGGKGSGGGGKAKTIENKEKKEHEKDYYEEVNSQLDKTEKVLSKIEKEEDRLIGDKARAKQNKQLDLLEKEINLNKEKQKIQQQELKDVDELFKKRQKEARDLALKNDVRTFMPEVQYDEDGIISNYEEISKALDDMHNGLIDKYNNAAKAGNEDLTKEIDKTIKKFDDYSKEILDNAKRHNKLQSEIEETTNELEELEDKIEDVRIDAYKAHQEAIDDLKDLRENAAEINAVFRDYNENSFLNKPSIDKTPYTELLETFYKLDTIFNVSKEDATAFYDNLIAQEKKALDVADEYERLAIESSIAYFEEQKKKVTDEKTTNGLLGLALQDLEQLSAWRDNPDVASNPFGKNTAALSEAYEDAFKRVNDLRKQQEELTRDARDSVLDLYDEIEDGIDRQLDGYDRLQDKLEQINDTYQLYYGEDSYENILKTMDQQSNTMQSQLDALKETYNYWVEQYQAALAVGDEKLIHEVEDRMNDAEEAMLDKAEELAEHFVDRYEKALDAGIQKMTNNLWGGGEGQMDLEDQSTMWELQKDYMDTYKDDVEKAYEIDKLRSKYIGLLNDAQGMSLQTQNKIRGQMQEQLDLLQNQKTVSEYDVKLANAKLEILQKQIALEDAQRNKNKMQLRRDTQGNYRYVYTAEQGDVQQAQDELNESQYDAYEMTKEQTIANNDRAVNLYQDYMNKIRDIANKYKDDEGARVAALAALNEEYKKLLGGLEEDFKDTTNGMYDVLTWMVENGTQDTTDAAVAMLDTLYDKNGQVKEDTGVAWRDLATQISNEVLPGIENEVIETFDTIENEADVLKDKLTGNNGALDLIGSAAKKMNSSLEEAAKTTENLAAQTEKLFSALGSDEGALKKALDKVHEYSEGLTNAQKRTDILGSSLNKATEDLQAEKSKNLNYKTLIDLKNGIGKFEKGQKYTIKKGTRIFYDRDGASQKDETGSKSYVVPEDVEVKVRTDYLTSAFGSGLAKYPVTIYPTNETKWGKHLPDTEGEEGIRTRQQQDWHIGITEFRDALKYDTGGYTGEWNEATSLWKNGKMAMLHQKELVLNSTDTENILSAVQLIRQLVSSNNNSLNTLKFNSNNANSMLPNSTIEQRVEIQATFPNATDADDIRTALLGLSDKAFQYAHRRI